MRYNELQFRNLDVPYRMHNKPYVIGKAGPNSAPWHKGTWYVLDNLPDGGQVVIAAGLPSAAAAMRQIGLRESGVVID